MALSILDLVAGIFKPAAKLIDEMHTSEEEKLKAKASLIAAQASAVDAALSYERKALEAQASIVKTEAGSEHFLTATWRPIVMLSLVGMVGGYWFGFVDLNDRLSARTIEQMFQLVQLGLGGYVAGRSVEKVVKAVKKT